MRLVILTTDTVHHRYFVREIGARFAIERVFLETHSLVPPFDIHHLLEDERDRHERTVWFGDDPPTMDDLAPMHRVGRMNDVDAVEELRAITPDAVVVFGTGRLSPAVIAACPDGMVNLHGGDPQRYRGLDSHLWAVLDGRFDALVTTLHRVNARLDDGELVAQAPVPISIGMELHELRQRNTEMCVDLVHRALHDFIKHGYFRSQPQRRRGAYYSFMPAPLKNQCVAMFNRYMELVA